MLITQGAAMKNRRKVRRSVKPRNNNGSESPLIDILPRDSANLFARLTNVTGGRHLEAILVRMPPGQERSEVTTHAGEEFVYVIAGQVSLTLDGKTFELRAGDSAHYESTLPHSWANTAPIESVVVWVGTPRLL
jgi:quercetin dioxygenase-like cupin family protein